MAVGVLEEISDLTVASVNMIWRVLKWICLGQSVRAGETRAARRAARRARVRPYEKLELATQLFDGFKATICLY